MIKKLKTFLNRRKNYKLNSLFNWSQWAKINNFWWQTVPNIYNALAI